MKTFCWFFFLFSFSFMICTVYCGFQHIKWKACSDTLLFCQLVHRRVLLFWRRICRAAPSLPSFFFFVLTFQSPETFVCCLHTQRNSKASEFIGYNIETFIFLFQHPKAKCFSLLHVSPPKRSSSCLSVKPPEYRKQTGTMSLCCSAASSLSSSVRPIMKNNAQVSVWVCIVVQKYNLKKKTKNKKITNKIEKKIRSGLVGDPGQRDSSVSNNPSSQTRRMSFLFVFFFSFSPSVSHTQTQFHGISSPEL